MLDTIDDSNEWLMGKMESANDVDHVDDNDELVFENDSLTWDNAARASGVNEVVYAIRVTTIFCIGRAEPAAKKVKISLFLKSNLDSMSKDEEVL